MRGPGHRTGRAGGPGRAGGATAVRRTTWPPGARLTGLGCGLLAVGAMVVAGGLNALLLDGPSLPYGISFVLVSAVCALWVRPVDLAAAPIAAPIAFTAGLPFLGDGAGGVADRLVDLVTALAVNAGWVYGGTLTALLVVLVRGGAVRRGGGGRRAGTRGRKAEGAGRTRPEKTRPGRRRAGEAGLGTARAEGAAAPDGS
ncbi:hypothetical protein F0L17_17190 [Streptomyces sp. TRM43335]|uniref:DUF6542 domain-containing protein n=1 Tax=Streptomyces taklimakanensis TaxID=2569853 RepID=A0A6G2BEV9_9ACTN|nr:DUF6542 domain-containing protein [Streptomyces taklimakanensis]MTE20817.1 hypothetical protein [Streptomyces taklimakanensis]